MKILGPFGTCMDASGANDAMSRWTSGHLHRSDVSGAAVAPCSVRRRQTG